MARFPWALRLIPVAFLIAISVAVISFAINQWMAEAACPIQRNFTRQGATEDAGLVAYALSRSPGVSAYHVLLGGHYMNEAAMQGLDEVEIMALLERAKEQYTRALYLEPSYTEALSYLARAKFSLGETSGALRDLETAIEIDPGNYFNRIYYGICVSEFLQSIPDPLRVSFIYRAREEIEKGAGLNPKLGRHPAAISAKAGLHLATGDIASAIEAIRGVEGSPKEKLPLLLQLAELQLNAQDERGGIDQYRRLLRSGHYDADDREKIAASLKGAARQHPSSALPLMLARELAEYGDWRGSIDALDGYRTQEHRAEAHFLRGVAYENLGEDRTAYEQYQKAVEVSGDHPEAEARLRELYRRSIGRYSLK